jgi:methyl-accepting chemotaxis protein
VQFEASSRNLSSGAVTQADCLEKIKTALETMAALTLDNSGKATRANDLMQSANDTVAKARNEMPGQVSQSLRMKSGPWP